MREIEKARERKPFVIRPEVSFDELKALAGEVFGAVNYRIERHGRGAFAGPHEGLGVITEEFHELVDAVRSNDPKEVQKEAMDVLVGCLWLIASSRMKDRTLLPPAPGTKEVGSG